MNFFSEKQKNREENSALSIVKLEPNIYIYIYIYIKEIDPRTCPRRTLFLITIKLHLFVTLGSSALDLNLA